MGLPKKTFKNIIIDDIEYSCLASGNDDIINLIITLKEKTICSFRLSNHNRE